MAMPPDRVDELVKRAVEARQRAYAPYSDFQVGAALLTRSGTIFTGANVENASYPLSLCAERVAVFKAVSEGEHELEAIAVVSERGGSPCGACRQVLSEFGLDTLVIQANAKGNVVHQATVAELLPSAFLPSDLER